jgi:hypothetical protein
MAVAINWCLQCQKPAGVDKGSKGMYCACGNKAQHFHSTGEFKHYTHLHMLQTCGEISRLQLQPRFPMFFNFINGTPVISPVGEWKWGTYVGDFLYFDKAGVQQVVDFKGHKDHQDRTSQKLREAAEHCYQFKVNIVTR